MTEKWPDAQWEWRDSQLEDFEDSDPPGWMWDKVSHRWIKLPEPDPEEVFEKAVAAFEILSGPEMDPVFSKYREELKEKAKLSQAAYAAFA